MGSPARGYAPAGYGAHGYGYGPPAARRRRRWPLRLLITLLILIGLLVAADFVARAVAQNVAAQKIQSSQHLSSKPDVHVTGFPFLTQFASGHYAEVDITTRDIAVGPSARSLTISSITTQLHDVTTSRTFASVHAATATADARITYADLSHTIGAPVSYFGPGRIGASQSVTIAGQHLTGSISVQVQATTSDGVRFTDPRVKAAGVDLPGLDAALGGLFDTSISLSGLPFDIRVTGLSVDSTGLVLHFAGQNLTYGGG